LERRGIERIHSPFSRNDFPTHLSYPLLPPLSAHSGTGKSVLLREIITGLRRKHAAKPDAVAVTASTGIAACNIGGVTLHSFSGIGLGVEDASILIQKIRKNKKAASRWLRTSVLIIDESEFFSTFLKVISTCSTRRLPSFLSYLVSMVDPILFDKLEQIARTLRKKPDVPFGGLQVSNPLLCVRYLPTFSDLMFPTPYLI